MLLPLFAAVALLQDPAPVHPDLAALGARWEEAMVACGVPALGMVLVEGDEVVHRATLGRRAPGRDAPVTEDTIFYIASATKPYVAFALARLAEAGAVDLDVPVKRYLPRFALADEALAERLAVRDLLCHRHGLNSGPIVLLDAYTGEITEERFYHFLPQVEPAGRVAYSNLHFTLAGRVIEAVSGKGWRDHLAAELFAPAGMTRTTGYADWMYAQDDVAIPAEVVDGVARPTAVRKSDRTMHAAGGLGTTLADLARWLRLQLGRGELDGKRLLSAEATEATWELQSESREAEFGAGEGFALGWQRGRYRDHLMLRHGGGYVGSGSHVLFLPELGLGLAVVATGGAAGALCELVSTDVLECLLADDEIRDLLPALLARAAEERARDAGRRAAEPNVALQLSLPLERYAGTFRDPWFGTLTLEPAAGTLRARLGELPLELSTPTLDVLRVDTSGPLAGEAALELVDGRVTAIVLDAQGPVRFVR